MAPPKRKTTVAPRVDGAENRVTSSVPSEVVDDDDICSICNLLLLQPVTTSCSHTFCESCFSHWADVSLNAHRIELGLDIDDELILLPNEIQAKCPMCRTQTASRIDRHRVVELSQKYPLTYTARSLDVTREQEDEDGNFVEPLTIYMGNEHALTRREPDGTANIHSWRFFLRFSRNDIIEEVHVWLHPTFKQHHIILSRPPWGIQRLGWGVFHIDVAVILKAGWSWMSSDAEDTPDGAMKGSLPLKWLLDFQGRGSQCRCVLKVKKQKGDQELEDERNAEITRRNWNRQRERDPDYVPPDDD